MNQKHRWLRSFEPNTPLATFISKDCGSSLVEEDLVVVVGGEGDGATVGRDELHALKLHVAHAVRPQVLQLQHTTPRGQTTGTPATTHNTTRSDHRYSSYNTRPRGPTTGTPATTHTTRSHHRYSNYNTQRRLDKQRRVAERRHANYFSIFASLISIQGRRVLSQLTFLHSVMKCSNFYTVQ